MEGTQLDAVEFRAGQRRDWGSAAKGWHDWQELIVSATAGVSRRLVEIAGIQAGDRVLDVAAGSGEPALTAAQVVGPQGEIVATDISPEMLAYARERAAAAGIDNVEFIEADASSLDFPPESFDAALSRWGIIFEPEAEAAAGRIRRFLKPGGRMAISSWGPPERVPMLAVPMRTVMTRLNVSPPPPGTPGPLSRPTSEAIAGILEEAVSPISRSSNSRSSWSGTRRKNSRATRGRSRRRSRPCSRTTLRTYARRRGQPLSKPYGRTPTRTEGSD
jgi:SAM-dependent methyltransferase